MTKKTCRSVRDLCLVAAIALAGGSAHAQGLNDDRSQRRSDQSIKVGEADLFPALRIDYLTDSNVGLRSADEVDGSMVLISPALDFVADRRLLALTLGYRGVYSAGSEDTLDWADHELAAGLDAEFDKRRRIGIEAVLSRSHETRGENISRGQDETLDRTVQYNTLDFDGRFTFGVEDARGNLIGGLRLQKRTYINFATLVDGRDYSKLEPYAQFSYRVGGDTRAVIELHFANYDFDNDRSDRDEIGVLGGLSFQATGKLSGSFSLGVERASYAAEGVDDESVFVVDAAVGFRPVSYSTLTLSMTREIDNTSLTNTTPGEGQSIRSIVGLGWNHDWSGRVSSRSYLSYDLIDRACPDRPTTTLGARFELNLQVRRWFQIGASVRGDTRSADDCPGGQNGSDLDYERQLLGAHVRFTL